MTMNTFKYLSLLFITAVLIAGISSCAPAEGNRTGSEYMMDMGHSIAFEANTSNFYKWNTWGTEEEYHQYIQPRLPQKGTIARGYASLGTQVSLDDVDALKNLMRGKTINGSVPYYYADTEEERERAGREILMNPFPITEQALVSGKELYNIFCGICHGDKADGNGYLLRDDGGKYPAVPANLISDEFIAASNGRFYHSIVYGKNVMGAYTDKLSFEERWNVIHYIRSLQAKTKDKAYSAEENTLNAFALPASKLASKTVEN
jgi:mono/diheme cytochrome c family protein